MSVAQENVSRGILTRARILNGDTIPSVRLQEVQVFARHRFRSRHQQRKWTRFIYNVKKALPYARLLSSELEYVNDTLALLATDKEREAFLNRKEKELFKKYEYNLKHLTITQGKILIKLIDRETGQTSYEIIRMLKGRFKAFWWQGIARLVGSNLKSEYDAVGTDAEIENVVLLIDMGVY